MTPHQRASYDKLLALRRSGHRLVYVGIATVAAGVVFGFVSAHFGMVWAELADAISVTASLVCIFYSVRTIRMANDMLRLLRKL